MGKKSESQPNRLKWLIAHRRIVATTVFQSVCLLSLTHSHSLFRNKPKKKSLRLWSFSSSFDNDDVVVVVVMGHYYCYTEFGYLCAALCDFALMAWASRQQLNHYQAYSKRQFLEMVCHRDDDTMQMFQCTRKWLLLLFGAVFASKCAFNSSLETRMHRERIVRLCITISEGQPNVNAYFMIVGIILISLCLCAYFLIFLAADFLVSFSKQPIELSI